ncbi:MAG: hypothetical protein WEB52_15485 [Dehalococcoidia bacterium]
MSKFADRIRRVSRLEAQPMGFVTTRNTADATMVLVGLARDARAAAEMAQRGADAVVVGSAGSSAGADDAKQIADAIPGAWLDGRSDGASKACKDGGYDFVLFDPDKTASTAVLEEGIGYVISVPNDVSDNELRAIEGFSLDALYVGEIKGAMTVRKQMELRRMFGLARKPLMASIPADLTQSELQALRDTNVLVVATDSADGIEKLRTLVDALPPRSRRKEDPERPIAMVPRSAPGAGEEDDDDDD